MAEITPYSHLSDQPENVLLQILIGKLCCISGFLAPDYTTAERNALTPENGQIIYNSTTSKFQGYAGGSWVDLN